MGKWVWNVPIGLLDVLVSCGQRQVSDHRHIVFIELCIDFTDKEDKDLQNWSCNTDCRVEFESPPLTMFAVKIPGATIPSNAETIHSKVFLGITSTWKKKPEETTKQGILLHCKIEVHSCSGPT